MHEYIDRRGLKPDGDAMMIYTGADDTGFEFKAAVPMMGPFDNPPKGDIAVGTSPPARPTSSSIAVPMTGWRTCTRRSPTSSTRRTSSRASLFIERYVTDPRTTPEDELVIEVIFPTK